MKKTKSISETVFNNLKRNPIRRFRDLKYYVNSKGILWEDEFDTGNLLRFRDNSFIILNTETLINDDDYQVTAITNMLWWRFNPNKSGKWINPKTYTDDDFNNVL